MNVSAENGASIVQIGLKGCGQEAEFPARWYSRLSNLNRHFSAHKLRTFVALSDNDGR
jgi:hypothetical protein